MKLDDALMILARVHTRTLAGDEDIPWVVEMGAMPHWTGGVSEREYVDAWRTVRRHLHLPVENEAGTP